MPLGVAGKSEATSEGLPEVTWPLTPALGNVVEKSEVTSEGLCRREEAGSVRGESSPEPSERVDGDPGRISLRFVEGSKRYSAMSEVT